MLELRILALEAGVEYAYDKGGTGNNRNGLFQVDAYSGD